MLVIRLFRVGKKNQPAFKIVVADKRNPPKAGRFVEEVGFWNPLTKEKIIKGERVKYWLSVGAQPSVTIHNLLVKEKIIADKKIPKHKKPSKESPVGDPTGQAKTKEGEKVSAEPVKLVAAAEKKLVSAPVPAEASVSDKSTADKSAVKEEKIEGEKVKETAQKPAEKK